MKTKKRQKGAAKKPARPAESPMPRQQMAGDSSVDCSDSFANIEPDSYANIDPGGR